MTPPPVNSCSHRDSPTHDRNRVQTEVFRLLANNDTMKHGFVNLAAVYSHRHIEIYDLSALGFRGNASLLVLQVSINLPISSFLDLDTEIHLSAIACSKILLNFDYKYHF